MKTMTDSVICDTRLRLMDEASSYRDQALNDSGEKVIARWDCERGHRWDKTLAVAQNVRCMNCAIERRELETRRLRELALVRGGALLSRRFTDATTPLRWQCAYGHVWDASADVASRRWCVECARDVFASYR
ncbi:hypothetical protein AWB80_00320 [Caballeronia pedi]|uniref:Uncharacterized protein n=1 Tax=Caballeronia pedi TaxID=1777141 RepID=A0A157Z5Z4_9BURK|nr:hypothetical protein [Caballeronia pedi]SAK40996.1 hypothetical protein AWB80_00320 [Caballeronia pedi]